MITLAYGDFERSSALGAELAFLARRSGSTVSSLGYLALLGAQTGRWSTASDERIDSVADGPPALLTLRASFLLELGRRDAAEHLYRSMPPLASVPGFILTSALSAAALLAAEFDDRSLAAEVHRRLHPYQDLFVTGGAGAVAVLGSARLHIGIAARTLGRFDEAVGHLRRAVEANHAAGMAPMATRARLELAIALARRARTGDRDEATALATSVAVQAGELRMEPLRLRSAELAARWSGRVGPLTTREEQVARLLAQALTNRQIAAIEHISERTVENHVRNILGKLGFTSRTQVAVWVSRRSRRSEPSPDRPPPKPARGTE